MSLNALGIVEEELEQMRLDMVNFQEKRDQIIKQARDITKNSKNAIYALHRGDFDLATSLMKASLTRAQELYPIIQEEPKLRSGTYTAGLEEYCEARIFEHFLKEGKILPKSQIPLVERHEYLGGIFDFTGELNRYAVLQATNRKAAEVQKCRDIVENLFCAFLKFEFRNGSLRKKFDSLKYTLRKMEGLLYDLSLSQNLLKAHQKLSEGIDASPAENSNKRKFDCDNGYENNKKRKF